MNDDDAPRYRLEDLRHFAAELGAAVGLAPARASALATHLLWFDAAGASDFGIRTLPEWLDRIDRGEIDPKAEGKVGSEHAGTAVFDARRGLPPLTLARAGGLAVEKAREVGIGLVRVTGLGPSGPSAAVAAEIAIGPQVGAILGPGPSTALAIPSAEGLPVVFDSALADGGPDPALTDLVAPWAALVSRGDWLVVAIAVAALEPLSTFHERVAAALKEGGAISGRLLPGPWDEHRRKAREHGVALGSTIDDFQPWADRFQVALPSARVSV